MKADCIAACSFSASECVSACVELMNKRAAELGMTDTLYRDPVGIDNITTASDMLRCLNSAYRYDALNRIWNKKEYSFNVRGKNAREMTVTSTVTAACDSHILSDRYSIIGGKTGTLSSYKARNLSVVVKAPESNGILACSVLYADAENGLPGNRFEAARAAIDAALSDNACEASVCAASAAVCRLPESGDFSDAVILLEKNSLDKRVPASMTKIMTAMLLLDCVPDIERDVLVTEDDIAQLPERFYVKDILAGDILTVCDLLHAMLLPSSNSSAMIVARIVGSILLSERG